MMLVCNFFTFFTYNEKDSLVVDCVKFFTNVAFNGKTQKICKLYSKRFKNVIRRKTNLKVCCPMRLLCQTIFYFGPQLPV